jgi:hypothetical protein
MPETLLVLDRENRANIYHSAGVQLDEGSAEFIRLSADIADADLTNAQKSGQFTLQKSSDNGVTWDNVGGFGFTGSAKPVPDPDTGSLQSYSEFPISQIGNALVRVEVVVPSGKSLNAGASITTE